MRRHKHAVGYNEVLFMVNAAPNDALEFVEVLDRNSRRLQHISTKRLSLCTKIHGVTPHDIILLNQFHGGRVFNHLTPNGHCMGRTAQLTSKCCILYIYSTNIRTEYFKHVA